MSLHLFSNSSLFTVVTLKLGDVKNHPTLKLSDSNVTLNLGDMMGHVSLLLSEAIVHIISDTEFPGIGTNFSIFGKIQYIW